MLQTKPLVLASRWVGDVQWRRMFGGGRKGEPEVVPPLPPDPSLLFVQFRAIPRGNISPQSLLPFCSDLGLSVLEWTLI